MDWKPLSVVFFCSFCVAGNGALAADGARMPDAVVAQQAEDLPVAMIMPVEQPSRTLALSSLAVGLPSDSPFALSVSERLQLREQIRKAAQDIYAERSESAALGNVSHVQGGDVQISP